MMRLTSILLLIPSILVLSNTPFVQAADQATPQNNDRGFNSPIFVAPPPPTDIGTPGQQRAGAGSRPRGCQQVDKPMAALVPVYPSKGTNLVWAATVSEQPTFWFYVPYASPSAYGEFVLTQPETGQQTIHPVSLPPKPGMIQVPLADTAASLEVGKSYHWSFNIYCQRNPDQGDSFVEGNVTRQRPSGDLVRQIGQPDLSQKVIAFANHGIWHEALNIAAVLHCARPNHSHWAQLLKTIGLSDLAQEPIAVCPNAPKGAR